MDIRKVRYCEIEQVLELIDQYNRPRSEWPDEEQRRRIFAGIETNGGCVIGAFVGGRLAGSCTMNVCPNLSWSGRPYAIIENVIVAVDHRRQGIGGALMKYAQDMAERLGCYKVALMTGSRSPGNLKLYESRGFVGDRTGFVRGYRGRTLRISRNINGLVYDICPNANA